MRPALAGGEYTADGTIKRFDIPFSYLDQTHIVVRDNDTKKVIVTDYQIDKDTKTNGVPEVVSARRRRTGTPSASPRKTPLGSMYKRNPMEADLNARQAQYAAEELADIPVILAWQASQTDLLAGTSNNLHFPSPVDGYIYQLRGAVNLAVTTGGVVSSRSVAHPAPMSLAVTTGRRGEAQGRWLIRHRCRWRYVHRGGRCDSRHQVRCQGDCR